MHDTPIKYYNPNICARCGKPATKELHGVPLCDIDFDYQLDMDADSITQDVEDEKSDDE